MKQDFMITAINTGATSKQVRDPEERELSSDELEHVSGGQIGIFRTTHDKREA